MDIYEKAVKIWIGRDVGIDPDKIIDVEFDVVTDGYCDTCRTTSVGISFRIEGKRYPNSDHVDVKYVPPAQFVREVSEIIQEGI